MDIINFFIKFILGFIGGIVGGLIYLYFKNSNEVKELINIFINKINFKQFKMKNIIAFLASWNILHFLVLVFLFIFFDLLYIFLGHQQIFYNIEFIIAFLFCFKIIFIILVMFYKLIFKK